LDPTLYLTLAVDSVAPLVRIRHLKGVAGGGQALDVPTPMPARQRRRMAFKWILDVVNKKQPKGSGRAMFPHRVAEEIVAVVEGKSSVWDKRQLVHKQGTSARANLNNPAVRRM
jgi:small subunit ribosomal protein S7